MLRGIPWTVLALAPVAHARIGRLSPDENLNECCPCPAPGQSSNGASVVTVTVTQPAQTQTVYVSLAQENPTHTVTVERTVTIDAHTVYVTQPNNGPIGSPRPQFTQQQPGPQTMTLIQGDAQGHTQPLQVTTTVQPESPKGLSDLEPKTVTLKADPPVSLVSVASVAQDQPSLSASWPLSVVTVTQDWQQRQQQQEAPNVVVTVTPGPEPPAAASTTLTAAQPQGPKTVIVTIQPSPSSVQPAAVTASLQAQTIVQTVDHYYTLTKTVGGGGGDNIEIIIINIFTGEAFCKKKHSGESCHAGGHHTRSHLYLSSAAAVTGTGPSQMPRPSVNVTTSVGSIYNTGIVTLSSGNSTGAAQPTGSRGPLGRKPRGPLSLRKW
ncbi:hypothetical protein E4U55_000268 [Claviceps digitariae]|nr:hypothetical protein E4U55_000268 [Claviceps digitariae]